MVKKKINNKTTLLFLVFSLLPLTSFSGKPSPENVKGAKTVDVLEAKKLWIEGTAFLDSRKDSDWENGRIPSAFHVDLKSKNFNADYISKLIPKNEPVVTYCNSINCHRAAKSAKKLIEWGWSNVYYFRNGYPSWEDAGIITE